MFVRNFCSCFPFAAADQDEDILHGDICPPYRLRIAQKCIVTIIPSALDPTYFGRGRIRYAVEAMEEQMDVEEDDSDRLTFMADQRD